jgi:CDP-4-dehydro-6-deoxyglucose reductase
LGKQQVLTLPCIIESVSQATSEVMRVLLRIPPDSNFQSVPGQYIELIRGDIRRSYSISGVAGNLVELYVGYLPGGAISEFLHSQARPGDLLHMEGPFGTFVVRDTPRKKLFVAGGTGAAPIISMVETHARQHPHQQLFVYWGARAGNLFYSDKLAWLGNQYANVHYTPVVSGEDINWAGHRGLVHQVVQAHFPDLAGFDAYACGPQAMIEAAEKAFVTQGLAPENFYADVFLASGETGVKS